jgi:elongation factor G
MFGYVTDLRTITSGRASSTMTFDHYAEVDKGNAKKVLTEANGRVDLI